MLLTYGRPPSFYHQKKYSTLLSSLRFSNDLIRTKTIIKKLMLLKIRRRWARGLNFNLGVTNVYASTPAFFNQKFAVYLLSSNTSRD